MTTPITHMQREPLAAAYERGESIDINAPGPVEVARIDHQHSIRFVADAEEVLRIETDGQVILYGRHTGTDEDVFRALQHFARAALPGRHSIQGAPQCQHCWHETGVMKTSDPPIHNQACCHCGIQRDIRSDEANPLYHGPYAPDHAISWTGCRSDTSR